MGDSIGRLRDHEWETYVKDVQVYVRHYSNWSHGPAFQVRASARNGTEPAAVSAVRNLALSKLKPHIDANGDETYDSQPAIGCLEATVVQPNPEARQGWTNEHLDSVFGALEGWLGREIAREAEELISTYRKPFKAARASSGLRW